MPKGFADILGFLPGFRVHYLLIAWCENYFYFNNALKLMRFMYGRNYTSG
jgi:hypothetical protein